MKKTILVCSSLFLGFSTQALDLTAGKGQFDIKSSMNPFISSDVTLDIDTISLSERHKNIRNSKIYYHFKLDYFDSDTVNKMTDIASIPLTTTVPMVGSSITDVVAENTKTPVPADYRIHGIDFDIGLGYDLVKNKNSTVGVSVNAGISTPFMKLRNIKSTAKWLLGSSGAFDNEVKTYKIGASLYAERKLNDQLSVSGSGSLDIQTGEMDNNIIGNGIDVDGSYMKLDLNVKYKPRNLKNFYITGGYTYNKWDYDTMKVNVPIGSAKAPGVYDMDFESNNIYVGAGYQF